MISVCKLCNCLIFGGSILLNLLKLMFVYCNLDSLKKDYGIILDSWFIFKFIY